MSYFPEFKKSEVSVEFVQRCGKSIMREGYITYGETEDGAREKQ